MSSYFPPVVATQLPKPNLNYENAHKVLPSQDSTTMHKTFVSSKIYDKRDDFDFDIQVRSVIDIPLRYSEIN